MKNIQNEINELIAQRDSVNYVLRIFTATNTKTGEQVVVTATTPTAYSTASVEAARKLTDRKDVTATRLTNDRHADGAFEILEWDANKSEFNSIGVQFDLAEVK